MCYVDMIDNVKVYKLRRAKIYARGDVSEANEAVHERSEQASGYIVVYISKESPGELLV